MYPKTVTHRLNDGSERSLLQVLRSILFYNTGIHRLAAVIINGDFVAILQKNMLFIARFAILI